MSSSVCSHVLKTLSGRLAAIPNRSQRGLYGGKGIQYGNKVSEDGGNKTRRRWKPNVIKKNLKSDILDKTFKLNITTYVLRCIKKFGGLDQYLLKTTDKKLASTIGSNLKQQIKQALRTKQQQQHKLTSTPKAEATTATEVPPTTPTN